MRQYQIHESGYRSATRHYSNGETAAAKLGKLVLKAVAIKLLLLGILAMAGVDIYPLVMQLVSWFTGS